MDYHFRSQFVGGMLRTIRIARVGAVHLRPSHFVGAFLFLVVWSTEVIAQYSYVTDPRMAHERFVRDLQNARVDATNFGPEAKASLPDLMGRAKALPGGSIRVCQTLEVNYPNGTYLALRTHHGDSAIDWVVHVTRSPERIMHVSAVPIPQGDKIGAPAILPMFTPGGEQSLLPPTQLGCPPIPSKPASDRDKQWACQRWPEMCRGGT